MNLRKHPSSRVAVVTGAGRGIGRAAALLLARAGAAVAACARTRDEVEETAALIEADGGRAIAVAADVSRWSDMERLAAEAGHLGPVELLVANAAVVGPLGNLWEVDPGDWADAVAVNLCGAFNVARAFLPEMRRRGRGVLVFLSSGMAVDPLAGFSAYAASKAGLEQLVRTLALELRGDHGGGARLRVHGLYPGVVDTAMQADLRSRDAVELPEAVRFRELHAGGFLRSVEEPARVICWLASPEAAPLHGQIVNVSDKAVRRRVQSYIDAQSP